MYKMKKNLEHIMHAAILGVILCFVMRQMGQSDDQACARSIVIASAALIYMIMFGHSFPPGNLNPALKF
jgi:hypothetical protein